MRGRRRRGFGDPKVRSTGDFPRVEFLAQAGASAICANSRGFGEAMTLASDVLILPTWSIADVAVYQAHGTCRRGISGKTRHHNDGIKAASLNDHRYVHPFCR